MTDAMSWLEDYATAADNIASVRDAHARPALKAAVKTLDDRLKEMEEEPDRYMVGCHSLERYLNVCVFIWLCRLVVCFF